MPRQKKNPSFRKTKKALAKAGAHIPSSRRAKQALKWPGQTAVSRIFNDLLRAALRNRKSAAARVVKRKDGRVELKISR